MTSDTGRLLVTGGGGQIGGALTRLARAGGWEVVDPPRDRLDLTSEDSIRQAVAGAPWTAVVNCAAYTAVDAAEAEPQLAAALNTDAPAILARETARLRVPLVHLSTDYVFDGDKPEPYAEYDPINPLSVYGRTKAAGEQAVRAANPHHAIVRTSWVVSERGRNFVRTILRLAAERSEIRVVDDQLGCPTAAHDLAAALLKIVADLGPRSGTWHFANAGATSWYGLAGFIFSRAQRHGVTPPQIVPIGTADYPTPARRPRNSRLSTENLRADFQIVPRPWQEAVGEVVDALCAGSGSRT